TPGGRIRPGSTGMAGGRRRYPRFADIRSMVSRSAYDQLGRSRLLLAGTVAGMALVYVAPPLLAVLGSGLARALAIAAWALMAAALQPIPRFYRRPPPWGGAPPALPPPPVALPPHS